ncbi:MAG: extracellular solute-binding protein [Clostridiales bacterium]|nr:extracellular solute-binding protein [Clostridiales bacterium]
MKRALSLALSLALTLTALLGLAMPAAAEAEAPTIEVMMSPWVSSPLPEYESDPYNRFLNEAYGANFKLTASTEFDTEVLLRFASDNPPDMVIFNSATMLNTLYDQGVMIDDWNAVADQLPQTMGNLTDLAIQYFTRDGKLTAMPTKAGDQLWSFHIRKDWLSKLGLSMPKNTDELLDVMRAFTHDDPDGNGQADTYGFTAAGGGTSVGELRNLLLMFGHSSFYINNGEVSHPFLDGSFETYLDFAKTIVSEGLIDPDWYTQGWDERKPNLFQGKFGVVWYPSEALLTETNEGRGNDQQVIDWYDIMTLEDMRLNPNSIIGTIRSVSADCAGDAAKMAVIVKLFESTALPNDDYYKVRYGYEIDNFIKVDLDGGYVYINKADTSEYHYCTNTTIPSLWNWGRIVCSYADGYLGGPDKEPNAVITRIAGLNTQWGTIDKYEQDYMLLNPDPTLTEESNRVVSEFEINYILGNATDYQSFLAQWKSTAGDALIEDAKATFEKFGLMQ